MPCGTIKWERWEERINYVSKCESVVQKLDSMSREVTTFSSSSAFSNHIEFTCLFIMFVY